MVCTELMIVVLINTNILPIICLVIKILMIEYRDYKMITGYVFQLYAPSSIILFGYSTNHLKVKTINYHATISDLCKFSWFLRYYLELNVGFIYN